MAVEDKIQEWLKDIDGILEENTDISDERWFKSICQAKYYLNKSLVQLGE